VQLGVPAASAREHRARAALDEYEHIIRTTKTTLEPGKLRYEHPLFQEPFGFALAMVDAAEHILLHCGETYMAYCERWAQTGEPFTLEDDMRLQGALQQAIKDLGINSEKPNPAIS